LRESQPARFWDSHLGAPGEKSHLDVGSVANHKVYYKGEGGGFPQVQVVVSLVCPCYSWLVLAPQVFQLCTNHFVWVVCRPVWVSEACQLFLVPSWSSNTPFYPSKCCELGSVFRLLLFSLFFTWVHIWILQGVGSASNSISWYVENCVFFLMYMYSWDMKIWCPSSLWCSNFLPPRQQGVLFFHVERTKNCGMTTWALLAIIIGLELDASPSVWIICLVAKTLGAILTSCATK